MKVKMVAKKGQAALIVLLVVFVALGFGLSIISQTTTDVRISEQEQESLRAFNAAEAGIEEALKNITVGSASLLVDDVQVDYTVTGQRALEGVFEENETAQVVLGGEANILTINWVNSESATENPGNCSGVTAESGLTAASLVITVVNDSNEIRRYGVNACSLNGDNGMTDVGDGGAGNYLRSYDVAVLADDVLVRIRPVYNRTSLLVTGATELPVQTYLIDSTAQAPTQETKAIEVTRTEPATPAVFDYVLFSGTNIIK